MRGRRNRRRRRRCVSLSFPFFLFLFPFTDLFLRPSLPFPIPLVPFPSPLPSYHSQERPPNRNEVQGRRRFRLRRRRGRRRRTQDDVAEKYDEDDEGAPVKSKRKGRPCPNLKSKCVSSSPLLSSLPPPPFPPVQTVLTHSLPPSQRAHRFERRGRRVDNDMFFPSLRQFSRLSSFFRISAIQPYSPHLLLRIRSFILSTEKERFKKSADDGSFVQTLFALASSICFEGA